MDYIDRIKQLKSEKKITNDELSELTGIPLGTLSKILAGIKKRTNVPCGKSVRVYGEF